VPPSSEAMSNVQRAHERQFDPMRREIVGQAHGVILEVGAGSGQNFPLYDPKSVVRVEAVEPDETMRAAAPEAHFAMDTSTMPGFYTATSSLISSNSARDAGASAEAVIICICCCSIA
jgi:hypothetical protein